MNQSDDVGIWLPVYIGEMLAMTTRLSTEQIGAFYLLMMDYWKNGVIPHDYKIIAAITGLSHAKSKTFITLLLSIQIFESDDDILFSRYLDDKKETATKNRKMKSERGKKAAEARWDKEGSDTSKVENNTINNQASSKQCISNTNSMLEQCPLSLSSSLSNKDSLSQMSSSLSIVSIKQWRAPTLDEINALLKSEHTSASILDSGTYKNHISKFKTYYAEQELKNNPILTDDRRRDVLVTWITNDRQYQLVNTKIKGQPHEKIIHKADSGQPNAFDSALSYIERSNDEVDSYFDAMDRG
ncbi:DUF1376 domain-containing protein [Psychrobacter sp. 16-MNA-CIBAN-0192]|uniref:DUF1376 domain-containing protein n=1 Tax=Psychrobacter sp. 16-MNA-CIBAN-0192 TaxID=3140448 RepID=UPI003331C78F